MTTKKTGGVSAQLALGTLSFVVCFAAWGLISSFAPQFRQMFHLSATQTAFLVAVPVILGALARLPMGMLTDLYGGRIVFFILMLVVAIPPVWASTASSYPMLITSALFLGLAGSSFAVGVGFVSRWYPRKSKGLLSVSTAWATLGSRRWCFLARCWRRVSVGSPSFAALLCCWLSGRSCFFSSRATRRMLRGQRA